MTWISLDREIMLQVQPSQVPERIGIREKKENTTRKEVSGRNREIEIHSIKNVVNAVESQYRAAGTIKKEED